MVIASRALLAVVSRTNPARHNRLIGRLFDALPWGDGCIGRPYGDTEQEVRDLLGEMAENFGDGEIASLLPPTDEQMVLSRQRLQRIDNPFGLLLAAHGSAGDFGEMLRRHTDRVKATEEALRVRLGG